MSMTIAEVHWLHQLKIQIKVKHSPSLLCTGPSHYLSVQFSCSVMSDSLQSHGLQHARLPCPSPTSKLAQTHVHGVGDAILPSVPLFPSPPAFNLSQNQGLFKWVWAGSRSWWWKGKSGMLQSMGSQRVWHDWATELNWTEIKYSWQRMIKTKYFQHWSKETLFERKKWWRIVIYFRVKGLSSAEEGSWKLGRAQLGDSLFP